MAVGVQHHGLLRFVLALDPQIVDEAAINACSHYLALLFEEASELNQAVPQRQLPYQSQVLIEHEELEVSAEGEVELTLRHGVLLHGSDGSRAGTKFPCSCPS